jgi:superfamily II DNA helicase RecQ
MRPVRAPADPEVSARLTKLRSVLAGRKTVWGGCPLEPDVLLRLARHPPAHVRALADVPGVGPALTERLGGTILAALGPERPAPATPRETPALASLHKWRAGVALEMGVPAYAVIPDAVLRAIAEERPRTRIDLARVRGVGPCTLAKFGDDLLSLSISHASSGAHTSSTAGLPSERLQVTSG